MKGCRNCDLANRHKEWDKPNYRAYYCKHYKNIVSEFDFCCFFTQFALKCSKCKSVIDSQNIMYSDNPILCKTCCLCGEPAGADGYCQRCFDKLAQAEYNRKGGKFNE